MKRIAQLERLKGQLEFAVGEIHTWHRAPSTVVIDARDTIKSMLDEEKLKQEKMEQLLKKLEVAQQLTFDGRVHPFRTDIKEIHDEFKQLVDS